MGPLARRHRCAAGTARRRLTPSGTGGVRAALAVVASATVLAACPGPSSVAGSHSRPRGPRTARTQHATAVTFVPWRTLPVTAADVPPPANPADHVFFGPAIPSSCEAGGVAGVARTRRVPGGVSGEVTLSATGGACSLAGAATGGGVLSHAGRRLAVRAVTAGPATVNPPTGVFPAVVEPHGRAASTGWPTEVLAFTWHGPYCGPRAPVLSVSLATGSSAPPSVLPRSVTVTAPVTGPVPRCGGVHGVDGPLDLGFVTTAASAGAPLPPGRERLVATLELPASVPAATAGTAGFAFIVVLDDPSPVPVPLQPCPAYDLEVDATVLVGPPSPPGATLTVPSTDTGAVNCAAAPAVLGPHQRVELAMRFVPRSPATGRRLDLAVVPGLRATVWWAIAGVPSAHGVVLLT